MVSAIIAIAFGDIALLLAIGRRHLIGIVTDFASRSGTDAKSEADVGYPDVMFQPTCLPVLAAGKQTARDV
ncbi:MAG: hypothetical protein ACJ8EH_10830 [Sphingomicrobium sp.]